MTMRALPSSAPSMPNQVRCYCNDKKCCHTQTVRATKITDIPKANIATKTIKTKPTTTTKAAATTTKTAAKTTKAATTTTTMIIKSKPKATMMTTRATTATATAAKPTKPITTKSCTTISSNFMPNSKRMLLQHLPQNRKFVKVRRVQAVGCASKSAAPMTRLGLGHSASKNSQAYSRRNSTDTAITSCTNYTVETKTTNTTTTPPQPNSTRQWQPLPRPLLNNPNMQAARLLSRPSTSALGSAASLPLSASASPTSSRTPAPHAFTPDYTAQRDYYEHARELLQTCWLSEQLVPTAATEAPLDARYLELQQFRLQNADDCFNEQRQRELKMQGRLLSGAAEQRLQPQAQLRLTLRPSQSSVAAFASDSTRTPATTSKLSTSYISPASTSSPSSSDSLSSLTPYAVRQRLLRLRMEAQEILSRGPKLLAKQEIGSLEKSMALRYQETY